MAGTQGKNLEAGAEAEPTEETLLTGLLLRLAQAAFL